jgi:thiamine kinase-like enzyme
MSESGALNCGSTTAHEALAIVSQFFDKEWPSTSLKDVTITKMMDGYSSTLHLVQRSTPAVTEPAAVLLRQQTGFSTQLDDPLIITEEKQALVYYEMSRRGWGPQLYGVAKGIRVEEYILSHTLTPKDCADPAIVADLARAYARMHSLDLPMTRDINVWLEEMCRNTTRIKHEKKDKQQFLRSLSNPDWDYLADHVFDVDWTRELRWLMEFAKENKFQMGYCQDDLNFLNVLVRDVPKDGSRIVLVDYECSCYHYRGYDIGGHFVNHMFNWKGKMDKLSGSAYPGKEQRQLFVESYLQAKRETGQQTTEEDTTKQLLLEADIGALIYCCALVVVMIKHAESFAPEPSFLSAVRHMFDFYISQKELVKNSL